MTLSSRERVLAAVNHREPDRVPLSLWGSWYGITDKLYFKVMENLGWEPVPPFRPDRVHSVNYYDDRLLEKLGVDVRHVDPGSTAATSRIGPNGLDAWGFAWYYGGLYRTVNRHPLQNATIDDIRRFPMPDAEQVIRPEPIQTRLEAIQAMDQAYAVIGRAVASYGFFEMGQSLRKHDQFLVDLVLNPELVNALIERIFDCYAAMLTRFLDIAGDHLDLLELPGDDFAGNNGMIISPDMFDQFFKEPYRRLIQHIKAHSPHVRIIYHSDGAITPLLSRLIDIGVDVVHPLEPLPLTDFATIKAEYGDQLTFMGGIDIRETMQGDERGVVEEVKQRLRQLARGGGYILAPANHLQWDVPPENLFALYEAAEQYGQYPLQLDSVDPNFG
jgi:uroporphyrinogen decarboxylase